MSATSSHHAPAKLNLFLHITGKRGDGYHLLESLVAFTTFGDRLEVAAADEISLEVQGPYSGGMPVDQEQNLIMRAARKLQSHYNIKQGARVVLHKYIPVGAGLGGGSSDAAAALKGLATLWQLPADDLATLALPLGSDIPACLHAAPAVLRGVGENITPAALTAKPWILLVNPGRPLLTADVYKRYAEAFSPPREVGEIDSVDALAALLDRTHNALEKPAIAIMPEIADMLAVLRAAAGCRLARMTGSGATCFALFEREAEAKAAALAIKERGWWQQVTEFEEAHG